VVKILGELELSGIPRLLVFNKSDLLDGEELANLRRAHNALSVSALDPRSLLPMVERIGKILESLPERRLLV
jgi:GTP-binding protein HflX